MDKNFFDFSLEPGKELKEKMEYMDKEPIVSVVIPFYNDKRYTQLEIAQMLSTSQDNISRTITKILEKLRYLFEQEGFGTLSNHPKQRKQRGFKTIYEFFDEYAKQQVDFAISKLPIEEKNLIFLRLESDTYYLTGHFSLFDDENEAEIIIYRQDQTWLFKWIKAPEKNKTYHFVFENTWVR